MGRFYWIKIKLDFFWKLENVNILDFILFFIYWYWIGVFYFYCWLYYFLLFYIWFFYLFLVYFWFLRVFEFVLFRFFYLFYGIIILLSRFEDIDWFICINIFGSLGFVLFCFYIFLRWIFLIMIDFLLFRNGVMGDRLVWIFKIYK